MPDQPFAAGPELGPCDDPHEFYLDHYRSPRNRRLLVEPEAEGTVEAANGAVLTVQLRLGVDDFDQIRIADAAFQSYRCGVALAYASLLTDLLPGMTLAEAAAFAPEALMSRFGASAIAGAAAGLAITALRRALAAARGPAAG